MPACKTIQERNRKGPLFAEELELQLQSRTARQKRKNWQLRSFAPTWQLGSECRCYVVRAAQMNGGKLKAEQSCTARILGFKAIQTFAIIQEIIQRSPASKTVENGQTLLLCVVCQIFPGCTSARIFKSLARFNESWLQLEVYNIITSGSILSTKTYILSQRDPAANLLG